jgi:hypothetical protein
MLIAECRVPWPAPLGRAGYNFYFLSSLLFVFGLFLLAASS